MCLVNRLKEPTGECESTSQATVAAAHPHFGEEKPLVGRNGSGTVFFGRCSLLCEYCQNFEISHDGHGVTVSDTALGDIMIRLQEQGCHNINLVTPTHFVPNIVQAVRHAVSRGLRIPLVYNTSSYDSVEVLRLLDGIVDIYLADYKYADEAVASDYSAGASDYPQVAEAAILEMHRQVGGLVLDEHGIAQRGLMVRHLVLPNNAAGTDRFVRFVAEKLGAYTYVNIMAQYHPAYNAHRFPELARRITPEEYSRALEWARAAGLRNVESQAALL
jgi:putative pyruvate formate lyase activating enzyme